MKILHYKATPIALAPDELSKAINKYSEHESFVYGHGNGDNTLLQNKYDILHMHNRNWNFDNAKKRVIQYHSEPSFVDLNISADEHMVISQYHATLPEFKKCKIIRNVIDFNNDMYNANPINKIRIGFSPSRLKKATYWHDKGYDQTIAVLNKLKNEHNVEIDIITDVPLDQCIKRKSNCNIIIDEVVTPSFHRSGLEGLALGKVTICSMSNDVIDVLTKASGSTINPFINIDINNLYIEILRLLEGGIDYITEQGKASREWMEQYWSPQQIINEFISIYQSL